MTEVVLCDLVRISDVSQLNFLELPFHIFIQFCNRMTFSLDVIYRELRLAKLAKDFHDSRLQLLGPGKDFAVRDEGKGESDGRLQCNGKVGNGKNDA